MNFLSHPHYGLGRVYKPDPKDQPFALRRGLLSQLPKQPRVLPWHIQAPLDQGNTPECVIHAYLHMKRAAPYMHPMPWSRQERTDRYHEVQLIDGIRMPHEGTTGRAACEIARQKGEIAEYLWINEEDTLIDVLHNHGPVMAGCDWFDSMFDTDKNGYVEPKGGLAGGHETMLRWYYGPSHQQYPDTYEFENSWGEWGWQGKGIYRLHGDAFRYLYWQLNGDLILPTDVKVVRK